MSLWVKSFFLLLLNILRPTEAKCFWIDTNLWHPSLPALFTNDTKLLPDTVSVWQRGSTADVGFTDSFSPSPEGWQRSGRRGRTPSCGAALGSRLCWAATAASPARGDGQPHHSPSGKKHTVFSSIAAPGTCVVLDGFSSSEADDWILCLQKDFRASFLWGSVLRSTHRAGDTNTC